MSSLLCGLSMCSDSRNTISESNIQSQDKPKNDNQNNESYQETLNSFNDSLSNIVSITSRPNTGKSSMDSSHWSRNTFITETDNTLKQRKRSKSRVRSRSIQTKIGTVLLFETDAMEIKGEKTEIQPTINEERKSQEMMVNVKKHSNKYNHNYRKYRKQNEKYSNITLRKEHQCKHRHRHKHGNRIYLNNQRQNKSYHYNHNNKDKNRRNCRRNSISHSLSDHPRKDLYRLSFENESDDIDDKLSMIGNVSITPRRNSISIIQRYSDYNHRRSTLSQQTRITPSYSNLKRSSICSKQSTSSMYVEDTDDDDDDNHSIQIEKESIIEQESILERIWEDQSSMTETESDTSTKSQTSTKYIFLDKGVVKSVIV